MKKVLLSVMWGTLALGAMAQTKPLRIESPIVSEKDFVWYVEQKEAWKAQTEKDPTNETAWLNYYNTTRYMSWFGNKTDSLSREVIRKMGEAIPNTYTYNYCAYRAIMSGHGTGETDEDKYAMGRSVAEDHIRYDLLVQN